MACTKLKRSAAPSGKKSIPLVERVIVYERTPKSLNQRIQVNGIWYHGWLTPSNKELEPGIPVSYDCILWNQYHNTVYYGPDGWTGTELNTKQDIIETIGDLLVAWYE